MTDLTDLIARVEAAGPWLTLECERALYVDDGRGVILCDRLPSPVKLVVKLKDRPALLRALEAKQ